MAPVTLNTLPSTPSDERRRDLGTLSKAELVSALLYAEGLECRACDAAAAPRADRCFHDGSRHPWSALNGGAR